MGEDEGGEGEVEDGAELVGGRAAEICVDAVFEEPDDDAG